MSSSRSHLVPKKAYRERDSIWTSASECLGSGALLWVCLVPSLWVSFVALSVWGLACCPESCRVKGRPCCSWAPRPLPASSQAGLTQAGPALLCFPKPVLSVPQIHVLLLPPLQTLSVLTRSYASETMCSLLAFSLATNLPQGSQHRA